MSYIVPKEIPSCCGNCPYNYSSLVCKITKSEIDRDDEYRERPEDCPLIEIPPHGRLIDADKFVYGETDCFYETEMDLKNAPTVIEAEGSKE